jgi:hypothetical protein
MGQREFQNLPIHKRSQRLYQVIDQGNRIIADVAVGNPDGWVQTMGDNFRSDLADCHAIYDELFVCFSAVAA